MKQVLKIFLVGSLWALAAAQLPAVPPEVPTTDPPVAKIQRTPMAQHEVWSLLQGSGPELYRDFCSSCHGLDGKGSVAVARALGVAPPDLTRLRKAGVSSDHVAYVLQSACEDDHHRAPDGTPAAARHRL